MTPEELKAAQEAAAKKEEEQKEILRGTYNDPDKME